MQKLTVLVITHKDHEFPNSACYLPIFVGERTSAIKNEEFHQDNSRYKYCWEKQVVFVELTGLYWAWQNGIFKNNQYVGLVHYRRYFAGKELYLKRRLLHQKASCYLF